MKNKINNNKKKRNKKQEYYILFQLILKICFNQQMLNYFIDYILFNIMYIYTKNKIRMDAFGVTGNTIY